MKVADGVAMLELSTTVMGQTNTVHPVLLWDDDTVILVDTGYPGQLSQIQSAMEGEGIPFARLDKVIITHHDIDHVGSLASLREAKGTLTVLAHADEQPYIQGDKQAIKLARMEASLASLPEQMKSIYQVFKRFYASNKITVDQTLTDGQELPWCGGIEVIHTPGHTLGHICLYLKRSRIMIAGDALGAEGGKLVRTPAHADYDHHLSSQSLKKLADYDIAKIICYHGGLYQNHVARSIAELVDQ